jgi:RNA polymerase sigma factor (sigma-70 family)
LRDIKIVSDGFTNDVEKLAVDEAFMEIWNSIKPWVITLLRRFFSDLYMRESEELLIEAQAEVFMALKGYDESKGAFSTYITNYIRHYATERYASKNNTSVYYSKYYREYLEYKSQFEGEGVKMTMADYADLIGITPNTLRIAIEKSGSAMNTVSTDDENYVENDSASTALSPEELALQKEQSVAIKEALEALSKEQREILVMRLGYNTAKLTRDSIAVKLNIPKERVDAQYTRGIQNMQRRLSKNNLYRELAARSELRTAKPIDFPKPLSVCDMFEMETISANIDLHF